MGDTTNTSRIDYILNASQTISEATKVEASFAGVGKAAQSAGVQGAAGMNQIEVAAKLNRADLALLNTLYEQTAAKQGVASAAAQQLAAELRAQGAAVGGVAAATAEATVAQTQNVAATVESNVFTEEAAAKQIGLSQAIRVGAAEMRLLGVAGANMGRSLSVLVGGLSSATLGMFAVILAAGFVIGKLIELARTKQEQIELDQEIIRLDAQIVISQQTGNLWTSALSRTIHDQIAIKQSGIAVAEQLRAAEEKETAAVRSSGEALTAEKATSFEAYAIVKLLGATVEQTTDAQARATAERQKSEQATLKWIEAEIRSAAATGQTRQQVEDATRAIFGEGTALQAVVELLNQGALAAQRFSQGQSIIGRVKLQAADAGEVLNRTQLLQRQKDAVAGLSDEERKLYEAAIVTAKNTKTLNDEHVRGAGAARAHALAENSLTRELKDAQAALIGDSFAARDQKITNDIAAESEALRIKKQLNTTAMGQLVDLEKFKHQKVAQDQVKAERGLLDELEQMRIAGLATEAEREQATNAFHLRKRIEEIRDIFGYTIAAEELIVAFRKMSATDLHRWLDDKERTRRTEWVHAESEMNNTIAAERLAIDKKTIAAGFKLLEDQNKKILELNRQFGANRLDLSGFGGQFEQARLLGIDKQMKTLGVDVKGVNAVFGTTTRTVEQLEGRLQAMESAGIDGLDALQQKIQLIQRLFLALGDAVRAGFEAWVSGSGSAGDAMLKSFLGALAQMAAAQGAIFITEGVGYLFTPGMHAAGVGLIAQGLALEALAGALGGAAALLGGSRSEASAGGAATTSGASAQPAVRPGVAPTLVAFPTSPPSTGPMIIKLDGNQWERLMKGEAVLTMPGIQGKDNRAVKRALKLV